MIEEVNQERIKAEQMIQIESSMIVKTKKETDLLHEREVDGVLYKYDLPVINAPLKLRNSLLVIDEEKEARTPTMNLLDELEIDGESSYEQFAIKLNQSYNNEIDMYGDIK